MTGRREQRPAELGFTLLELLVAVMLLGLLMAALFGGLRLGARVWETGETRLDANARIQIIQEFIRQRLAEALPSATVHPEAGGDAEPAFRGGPESVRFAALMPEHLGGGFALMDLALSESGHADGTKDLVLSWRPLEPGGQPKAPPAEPERRIIVEGIESMDVAYFGAPDRRAPPEWWPLWQQQPELPRLVRLNIRFPPSDGRDWPDLIVRPMVDLSVVF
jgi:general secretion pathway protein J